MRLVDADGTGKVSMLNLYTGRLEEWPAGTEVMAFRYNDGENIHVICGYVYQVSRKYLPGSGRVFVE